eukprot:gene9841-10000_t
MGFSLLARGVFAGVGELSRPWWQGLSTSTAASHVAAAKKMKRVRRKEPVGLCVFVEVR